MHINLGDIEFPAGKLPPRCIQNLSDYLHALESLSAPTSIDQSLIFSLKTVLSGKNQYQVAWKSIPAQVTAKTNFTHIFASPPCLVSDSLFKAGFGKYAYAPPDRLYLRPSEPEQRNRRLQAILQVLKSKNSIYEQNERKLYSAIYEIALLNPLENPGDSLLLAQKIFQFLKDTREFDKPTNIKFDYFYHHVMTNARLGSSWYQSRVRTLRSLNMILWRIFSKDYLQMTIN